MELETISKELSESRIAWLAGIMDGEGWLMITDHSKRQQEIYGYYSKRIRAGVGNTDIRMISEVSKIWKALGITFHYQLSKRKDILNAKNFLHIETGGKRNVLKLVIPILPYMVNKRDQALVCKEYCEYRLSRIKEKDDHGKWISTMTEKDNEYMERLKFLKHNLKDPSETKRKASEILMI